MSDTYFVAIVLYRSSSSSADYRPMYDEGTVLVRAADLAAARARVTTQAASRSAKFKNEAGQEIEWAFEKLVDIAPMLDRDISDLTELYSRHFHDINAYRAFEKLAN